MSKHTPTPVDELADWVRAQIRNWDRSTDQNRKAGAKMVEEIADRAVNVHDVLMEALVATVDLLIDREDDHESCDDVIKQARAALAKARETN